MRNGKVLTMEKLTDKWWKKLILAFVAFFILIQLVPYGRDHQNPPVVQEPNWDRPETRQLVQQACFDCHSNEVEWPWYSYVAPASWLVQYDVEEGRDELNFSDWGKDRHGEKFKELKEVLEEGEMPLKPYVLLHPEANLSDAQRQQLLDGLAATIQATSGSKNSGGEEDDHDHDHDEDDD